MPLIHLEGHAAPYPAEPGENVLDALARGGAPVTVPCAGGDCGRCKIEIVTGTPVEHPHAERASSAAERAQGILLGCRTEVVEDLGVRLVDPDELVDHPPRELQCRLIDLSPLARDIWRLVFRIESGGPFRFSAGQYARIEFVMRDGERLGRDYSMASTPHRAEREQLLEFHVRAAPGGKFATVLDTGALALGDVLRVHGPEGTSHLRARSTAPMLLIAGGTGLGPILSIAETAVELGMRAPMRLYLGVRDEPDVYDEHRLRALATRHANFRYEVVLSAPTGTTRRRTGLVTDAVFEDHPAFDGMKIYLAGPPAMTEAAAAQLVTRGARERDIHADAFYPDSARPGRAARLAA